MIEIKIRIKADIHELDRDVIQTLPRAILQRFENTPVKIRDVVISADDVTIIRREVSLT